MRIVLKLELTMTIDVVSDDVSNAAGGVYIRRSHQHVVGWLLTCAFAKVRVRT